MRDHVAICFESFSRSRASAIVLVAVTACFAACSSRVRDPVEVFSSNVALGGEKPVNIEHSLQRGVYLLEASESGIDARINIVAAGENSTLENKLPRYGAVFKVVSLDAPASVRLEATSADHVANHGNVVIRIWRWARAPN